MAFGRSRTTEPRKSGSMQATATQNRTATRPNGDSEPSATLTTAKLPPQIAIRNVSTRRGVQRPAGAFIEGRQDRKPRAASQRGLHVARQSMLAVARARRYE